MTNTMMLQHNVRYYLNKIDDKGNDISLMMSKKVESKFENDQKDKLMFGLRKVNGNTHSFEHFPKLGKGWRCCIINA